VERVASALGTDRGCREARLSRGRKLLQEQVALFVEGALRQSTPGRAFTLGVIAALPLMTASATAATIGTRRRKAEPRPRVRDCWGCSACCSVRSSAVRRVDRGEGEPGQRGIRTGAGADPPADALDIALVAGFLVVLGFAMPFAAKIWHHRTATAFALVSVLPILYVVTLVTMILRFRRAHDRLRAEEAPRRSPEAAARHAEAWKTYEYKSPWTLFGLPLVHVRSGRQRGEKLRPAVGWIAIGDGGHRSRGPSAASRWVASASEGSRSVWWRWVEYRWERCFWRDDHRAVGRDGRAGDWLSRARRLCAGLACGGRRHGRGA